MAISTLCHEFLAGRCHTHVLTHDYTQLNRRYHDCCHVHRISERSHYKFLRVEFDENMSGTQTYESLFNSSFMTSFRGS